MFILEEELQRRKFKNVCLDELRVLVMMMMMMMMIFIYVRRVTSEAGSPETSRRVWGRAKLWNYST
jgi:hypothetical protein